MAARASWGKAHKVKRRKKRGTKRYHRAKKRGHIPLPVLKKRLARLQTIVASRSR